MQLEILKADSVLKDVSKKLLPENKGKIIAIDVESGDYAIGSTTLEAYKEAIKKHPNKKFVFKRLGFDHTYFAGAF